MPRNLIGSSRLQNLGLAVAILVTVGISVVAVHRTSVVGSTGAAAASSRGAVPGAANAAGATPNPPPSSTPERSASRVPADVKALFFGDGLMVGDPGVGSTTMSELTTRNLGWSTTVDARAGSGFTAPGGTSYLARITAAVSRPTRYDVVLIEGGSNDVDLAPAPGVLAERIAEVVAAVRANQPQAAIVLMGVYSPFGAPVSVQSRAIDTIISDRAQALGVPHISLIDAGWLGGQPALYTSSDKYQPSPAGQMYLADRLGTTIRSLSLAPARP